MEINEKNAPEERIEQCDGPEYLDTEMVERLVKEYEEKVLKEYDSKIHYAPPDNIYPCTIVADRYGGVYTGGAYTAWPLDPSDAEEEIDADDMFYYKNLAPGTYGKGATPNEAYDDLYDQLAKLGHVRPKGISETAWLEHNRAVYVAERVAKYREKSMKERFMKLTKVNEPKDITTTDKTDDVIHIVKHCTVIKETEPIEITVYHRPIIESSASVLTQ